SVDAQIFVAEQAADADKHDEARQALARALAVNPASLEANALVAALHYVEDHTSEFETALQKTLAIAPKYGDVFRIAGELTAHGYRFDEAVALTRRGLAIDPGNARLLAALGLQLMRTGDEPGARTVLEESFKLDAYDRITYNLLQLLDTLDK